MNNAINVDLYGDGSRSARLRAEYIYCDYAEECTAYKQGQCFAVSAFLQPRCKLGKVSSVDGGLKRSKKFDKVYSEAKDNENYHKLEFPLDLYFAKVNEKMYVAIPYICVKALDDGNIKVDGPSFGIDSCVFENKHITSDNFIKILEFHPQAIFGGEITNYQNKIVGLIENGTWAPNSAKCMKEILNTMKNIDIIEPVVTIKSKLSEENCLQLYKMAEDLIKK